MKALGGVASQFGLEPTVAGLGVWGLGFRV